MEVERFKHRQQATRAVNLKVVSHNDDDLWSFVMLPNVELVSTIFPPLVGSCFVFFIRPDNPRSQLVTVHVARSDPPTPLSQVAGRAAQEREQERAALAKERKIRRRERLEQYNEEHWLREQQGLSPPPALANSLSDEEESNEEWTTSNRWEPAHPSAQAEGAAVELTLGAGTEPPAAKSLVEVPAGTAEVPAGAVEVPLSPRGRGSRASPV
jgi:hypothetical protein